MRYGIAMRRLLILAMFAAAAAVGQVPTVTQILNNYGLDPLTNSENTGIAQGSIFIVKGTNLSSQTTSLQSAPLSTTLQGVRIRITSASASTYAPLYYASPTQLAGILPSSVPVGSTVMRVESNGQTSEPASFNVVKSAFGTLTLNGAGIGIAAVHDQDYVLLSKTNATNPGKYVTFYGSGIGPTTKDETVDQTGVNASGDLTDIPVTVTIGGKKATVLYRGRTQYPGLDQINVQIPALDPGAYGCGVLVYISAGGVFSNITRIPIAESGKTCADPPVTPSSLPGMSQSEIDRLLSSTTVKYGALTFTRASLQPSGTGAAITTASATANFRSVTGPDLRYYFTESTSASSPIPQPTLGNCVVMEINPTSSVAAPPVYYEVTSRSLDAGASLSLQGAENTLPLPRIVSGTTIRYAADLANTTLPAGAYTLTGTGGPDVAALSAAFNMLGPFVWTNKEALPTVTRANGMTFTWSGGDPSRSVYITGISTNRDPVTNITTGALFNCAANAKDGTFTVPPSILNRLPATSNLSVPGLASVGSFTRMVRGDVPGFDYFGVGDSTSDIEPVNFQ